MNTAEDEQFLSICSLFNESQFHVSAHRKNIQSLRKIHAKASGTSQNETKFLQAFCHCLHTILSFKKADDVCFKVFVVLINNDLGFKQIDEIFSGIYCTLCRGSQHSASNISFCRALR
jgi:hypothetical protein